MRIASRWGTYIAVLIGSLTASGCFSSRACQTGCSDAGVMSHGAGHADCAQCRNRLFANKSGAPEMTYAVPSGPVAKNNGNSWNTARTLPPGSTTTSAGTLQPPTGPLPPGSPPVTQTSLRGMGGKILHARGGPVVGDPIPGSQMPGQYVPPGPGFGPLGPPIIPGDPNAPPMHGDPHHGLPGQHPVAGPGPVPTELSRVSLPPYTVSPPDILFIDTARLVPKPPYLIEPLEVLLINVTETLPGQPIAGPFTVSPEGTISLGFSYGNVRVGGMTLDQANAAIRAHLGRTLRNAEVTVALQSIRAFQQVRGEHLVRPDGTISLGSYGSIYVAGLTMGQIKCVLERYLGDYFVDPKISVDVFAYNSKVYYVIVDGAGYGQQVFPFPITGNETVLDAVSKVGGLAPQSSKRRIWVARPSPCGNGCNQILPVDWRALTEGGSTCTNYQIFPGDRIYVAPNPLIRLDNVLAQMLAPIERILGVTFLGVSTYQAINGNLFNNNN